MHRHFGQNLIARLLPVGKNLKRRRHSESESCPCCGLYEDHDHIIQCKHPEMEQRFNKSMVDISTILTEGTNEIISGYVRYHFRIPGHASWFYSLLSLELHVEDSAIADVHSAHNMNSEY